MKVYLSPSDQHRNITASGHSEADHCIKIANACAKYLTASGYDVKVGNSKIVESYPARVRESNAWGADLHVPIHTNAGGGKGTLMMAYDATSAGNKYVKGIYESVAKLTPTPDRGVQIRTDLYEINATNCVCAYLECEFHDNVVTENWIDENIDNLGKAIAVGIIEADGKTVTETNGLYRVQVGAFSKRENAYRLCEELKSKGYDCFVRES